MEVSRGDFEKIKDALEEAMIFFKKRDEMNAQVHLAKEVRYSPITSVVEMQYVRASALIEEEMEGGDE